MRPSCLERHLRTTHPDVAVETKHSLKQKERHSTKQAKLIGGRAFWQQCSMADEASYEIAILIAKNEERHNTMESLIKPSLLRATELILRKS